MNHTAKWVQEQVRPQTHGTVRAGHGTAPSVPLAPRAVTGAPSRRVPPEVARISLQHLQRVAGNRAVSSLFALTGAGHDAAVPCLYPVAEASPGYPGVVQREVVTQITAGDADRVEKLNVVGRPDSPFKGTMGDHTTPFGVVLESVRIRVEGQTFSDAVAKLGELFESTKNLPGQALVEQLPNTEKNNHKDRLKTAMNHVGEIREEINSAAGQTMRWTLLQQLVDAYLHYRELLPLSVINVKEVNPVLAGKGKGEAKALKLLREHTQNRKKLEPPELRNEITAMFDRHAVALQAVERNPDTAAKMLPGSQWQEGSTVEERVMPLIDQHLTTITTAFPDIMQEAGLVETKKHLYRSTMLQAKEQLNKDLAKCREDIVATKQKIEKGEAQLPHEPRGQRKKIEAEIKTNTDISKNLEIWLKWIGDQLFVVDAAVSGSSSGSSGGSAGSSKGKAKESDTSTRGGDEQGEDEGDAQNAERKAPLTTQIILSADGTIADMRSAGRASSPFSGTMGRHSTAWLVHLDVIRTAIKGRTVPDAVAAVTTKADEYMAMSETLSAGFRDEEGQADQRETARAAMVQYPDKIGEAGPAVQPLLLQSYINALLTYVNLIPGITANVTQTGGDREAGHRKTLTKHQQVDQSELQEAIWGLLDIPEQHSDEQGKALVANHIDLIGRAYPNVLENAGVSKDNSWDMWSKWRKRSEEYDSSESGTSSGSSRKKQRRD